MEVGDKLHAPVALTPGKSPGTHYTGGWVVPRADLDGWGKSRPPTNIRSPDRPARSESLRRLRYSGPANTSNPLKSSGNYMYRHVLRIITLHFATQCIYVSCSYENKQVPLP